VTDRNIPSKDEMQCRYCKRPADLDGSINHVGGCLGLERVWLNQLQYDRLVQPDHTLVLRICTAYEQGYGQSGRALENPYSAGTRESEAWNMGWQIAKQRSVPETTPKRFSARSLIEKLHGYVTGVMDRKGYSETLQEIERLLAKCEHGAATEEVCPECLGAPSDNPNEEARAAVKTTRNHEWRGTSVNDDRCVICGLPELECKSAVSEG
jgi:hypothetical protein